MNKYSASYLLWDIIISDSGSVSVYEMAKRCDNTKKALQTIAKSIGLTVEEKWTSRQLARRVIDRIHEMEQEEANSSSSGQSAAAEHQYTEPRKKPEPEKLSETLKRYLIGALFWKYGYRFAACVLWLVILNIVAIPFHIADNVSAKKYEEEMDYRSRCAEGNFTAAHDILAKLHTEYHEAFVYWRIHGFQNERALTLQERYRTAFTYIFGQEIAAMFADSANSKNDNAFIQLIVSIPVDGVPLKEGVQESGMFYNNDAGANAAAIDHVVYQSWVRFYNDRCEQLLDMALTYNDPQLAKKIIRLYKTEVETRYTPDTVRGDNYSIATVTYNNKRQEQALRRLAEHQQAE